MVKTTRQPVEGRDCRLDCSTASYGAIVAKEADWHANFRYNPA